MRAAPLALAVAALLIVTPARAGSMDGFSTETTQWANFGELFVQTEETIRQTIHQAAIVEEQIRQTAMAVENLKKITPTNMLDEAVGKLFRDRDMLTTFTRLRELYINGQRTAYTLSSLDARFRSLYPDYDPAQTYRFAQQYGDLSRTTNAHLQTAAAVVGVQAGNFATEEGMIERLQEASQTASGAMGALQAGNQISVALVGQMQQMRQLQMAQMQVEQAHVGQQSQNQAAARRALEKVLRQPRGPLSYEELIRR